MKKSFLIAFLLLQVWAFGQTKNEVLFKIQYKPQATYSNTIQLTSQNIFTYGGSEEILADLKESGMENPMTLDQNSTIKTVFRTGKIKGGKEFPIQIEVTDVSESDGGKSVLPKGLVFYGNCAESGLPKLDSLSGISYDESTKKALLDVTRDLFLQIDIPEKRIKVGDTFSQSMPISIPGGPAEAIMDVVADYKLISITNNFANFDIQITYKINSGAIDSIQAIGKGTGKMTYDTKNFYITKHESNTEISLDIKDKEIDFSIKSKQSMVQTSTLTN